MIKRKLAEELNNLLPAYINGALNPVQRKIVELWLAQDEQARRTAENLRTLQAVVRSQPRRTPPPAVLGRIQAQIRSQQSAEVRNYRQTRQSLPAQTSALGLPILLLSVVTLLLAAMIMWQTLPPGIVLQWSIEGRTPEAFRVYRAELVSGETAEDGHFELLQEVPASEQERQYTFTDFRLLPGQNYIYRVEGLNASGQPAASQTIAGQAIDALPGQLAILLVIVFAGYCFLNIFRLYRPVTVTSY